MVKFSEMKYERPDMDAVVLGFSFEDDITNQDVQVYNVGTFHVVKVRMNDDLLQEGLTNKDKAAGSFIIIGEPDIQLVKDNEKSCHIEIRGMDMYDPIQDRVTERNVADIAYWEMDDKYNGREFNVRSIHFCGGCKRCKRLPVSGRSPGERNGNPLQYSCLENPMDRGAW